MSAARRPLPPLGVAVRQNHPAGKPFLAVTWSHHMTTESFVTVWRSAGRVRPVLGGPPAGLHPHPVLGPIRLQKPQTAEGET